MSQPQHILRPLIRPLLRHLSTQGSGGGIIYDADALTWYNAVVTAGGAGEWGSSAGARLNNKNALNTMVKALKAASLWAGFKMRVLAGTNSIAGGLASGVGGTVTNNNFVSGDINPLTGWIGNGSTKRLSTNWAGNANGQDDFSWFVWQTSAVSAPAANDALFGNSSSALVGNVNLFRNSGSNLLLVRAKALATDGTAIDARSVGLVVLSRTTGTDYTLRCGGINYTRPQSSDGNLATSMDFFARDGANFSSSRLSVIGGGPGISAAGLTTLDAILTAYHNAIQA